MNRYTTTTSANNWLESIEEYFTDDGLSYPEADPNLPEITPIDSPEETPVYTGDFLDINVRTYHLEKYPFENEYHLEIDYLNSGMASYGHLIPPSTDLKTIIDHNIANIKNSKYQAKFSINGKLYKTT